MDPHGLKLSSLASIVRPGFGLTLRTSTRGVLPIRSRIVFPAIALTDNKKRAVRPTLFKFLRNLSTVELRYGHFYEMDSLLSQYLVLLAGRGPPDVPLVLLAVMDFNRHFSELVSHIFKILVQELVKVLKSLHWRDLFRMLPD